MFAKIVRFAHNFFLQLGVCMRLWGAFGTPDVMGVPLVPRLLFFKKIVRFAHNFSFQRGGRMRLCGAFGTPDIMGVPLVPRLLFFKFLLQNETSLF